MALRPRIAAFAVALVLLGACLPVSLPPQRTPPPAPTASSGGIVAPQATVAAGDMTPALLRKPIPPADIFDLVRRMKGRDGTPPRQYEPVRTTPPAEGVGSTAEFWVYDFSAKTNVKVAATLRVETENAKWWVETDVAEDPAQLAKSAQVFQDKIYPTDRRLFGSEWTPGIDDDPRIDILMARIPGAAAGYFSATDELPRWVNQYSAEREMIYVNALAARPGTDDLHDVLAHEFCHMIQFNDRKRAAAWFDEGQAQTCERANGYTPTNTQAFLNAPNTQLDAWAELDHGAREHYGAAYLFLEYLRARTGGSYAFIRTLMDHGVDTTQDIDTELRAKGYGSFDEILADFVAANAFIGWSPPATYAYPSDVRPGGAARPSPADHVAVGGDLRTSAYPEAARYVQLPSSGTYRVHFEAPSATRIIPTDAHSGHAFWWSDRADGMDSTLTRTVDLGSVTSATLTFWSWYEIEKDFDYGYVAVSTDGGTRWTTLATGATTTSDPNGDNLGNGLTGVSGGGTDATWVEQRADLTPYAGKRILLRFEYVTDPALNLPGLAIDDVAIPQIGYRDDAETDNGWVAKGFIRSTNTIRESYIVQVLHFGATPTVDRHVVTGGSVDIEVSTSGDRSAPLLAVTPLAVRTTDAAPFEVKVSATP
ncbi:MAG: immune inhibitor A [Chloroflexota bacterium]|nr:immune inhibitor A [Chloroflexota bacterium]